MFFVHAIILAVVEGITEFLPVSSTAHLLLLEAWVSLGDDEAFRRLFDVLIQFPAILAVVVYFRHDLIPFGTEGAKRADATMLWAKALLAVVPVGVLGVLTSDFVDANLRAPAPIAVALLLGGVVIVWIERRERSGTITTVGRVTFTLALLVGLIQCLAIMPGVSRSGATILGAMLLGFDRATAAKFSFIVGVPTIGGAAVYTLFKSGVVLTGPQGAALALGMIVAFLVALLVVSALMRFIQTHRFSIFGYYRIVLACAVLFAIFVLDFGS